MIKKIFTILLLLCPYALPTHLSAQLYSTAEAALRTRSYGGTAMASAPTTTFRSTSVYSTSSASTSSYATSASSFSYAAPVSFANGSVRTIASTLTGGVLADDAGFLATQNYTSYSEYNDDDDGWGTGTPDLPLSLDWDALLIIILMAGLYTHRRYRKHSTTHT